jgi:hypothetical protein
MKKSCILNTDSFGLTSINDFTYTLNIYGEYSSFIYNTLQKMIKSCHLDYETNTIIFSAEVVIPFKEYLLNKNKNKQ